MQTRLRADTAEALLPWPLSLSGPDGNVFHPDPLIHGLPCTRTLPKSTQHHAGVLLDWSGSAAISKCRVESCRTTRREHACPADSPANSMEDSWHAFEPCLRQHTISKAEDFIQSPKLMGCHARPQRPRVPSIALVHSWTTPVASQNLKLPGSCRGACREFADHADSSQTQWQTGSANRSSAVVASAADLRIRQQRALKFNSDVKWP